VARGRILKPAFYARPAELVAEDLLGKYLIRQVDQETIAARITETEAYIGPHDLACHARAGRTSRTAVMFGPGGIWYVYLIYGMYWMLNVVTGEEDYPAAVLFRTVGTWTGPGKLTRAMSIDKSLNGLSATRASGLWIEDRGPKLDTEAVCRTPRIGVDYAGEWKDKLYRYVLQNETEAATSRRKRSGPKKTS